MTLLVATELAYSLTGHVILAGADLHVDEGEVVAVTGASGSGKTTLLQCLAGIQRPSSGVVSFDGERIDTLSDDARASIRLRSFGFVLQHGDLLPQLTLVENVALPLLLLGRPRSSALRSAQEALERFEVPGPVGKRFPGQVSGGEAQRAAVARALVHGPRLVFADEPTGSLDEQNSREVMSAFLGAAREEDRGVVIVTHDHDTAAFADRVLILTEGRLRETVLR